MLTLFSKMFRTESNILPIEHNNTSPSKVTLIGREIEKKVKKMYKGSLAIRLVDAGSDNACEQELSALSNNYYNVERFGIHFVASPRHADMLMVTGPVTRNMVKGLKDTYAAVPNPKIVVAVGDDALDGGMFKNSYAVVGGVKDVIPVDYHIPGDPPSPQTIIEALLSILSTTETSSPAKK